MPPAGDALSRVVAALAARPAGPAGRRVLALDGPSGSGKTTLADRLAARLAAGDGSGATSITLVQPVTLVRLDDLYPGWDGLEAGVDRLLGGVLAPLARGEAQVVERRWDWIAGHDGAPVTLPATPVTVVEGVGSGALRCAPLVSLLVWLDGPVEQRRERALARDGDMFAPHWDRWAAQERAHFARERTRERADVVLGETQVSQVHEPG